MQHYQLDRITSARLEADSLARDPAFDLTTHAARAFGSFHRGSEYGKVFWRFTPAAATTAREFLLHSTQAMTEEEDGSLTVRFTASGHLEMAWHLYMWGTRWKRWRRNRCGRWSNGIGGGTSQRCRRREARP